MPASPAFLTAQKTTTSCPQLLSMPRKTGSSVGQHVVFSKAACCWLPLLHHRSAVMAGSLQQHKRGQQH